LDLFQFFREEPKLRNKKFDELLKLYPKDVKENINLYIKLHKAYFMLGTDVLKINEKLKMKL
jgi:hypothetical protein